MSYEQILKQMGYAIEPVELDTGKFMQAVRTGKLIYTSGQVSSWAGRGVKGKIGGDLTIEQGIEGARFCTLNNLRAIRTICGSLDNIVQFVKVMGMVNVAPGFDDTPRVINGCSDLLREVFGKAGQHSRSAVGMTVPLGWAVEIEMVVEVK
jgi:enamine deaminase RidA (YjgF/YER057c/UK114 family)